MNLAKFIVAVCVTAIAISAQAQKITELQFTKATSIRGLSVVDDNVAWVSGSKGTIGITHDGGKSWAWQQIAGYEKSDFRDIEAFNDKEAVIIASGTPAVILKTTDGGKTWQQKYNQTDAAYFLDAMDFADKQHGWVLGDPIAGKLLLLETTDGGETWQQAVNTPDALKGEASFAASGTCLRTDKFITIVTGGGNSRIISSPVKQIKWTATVLPLTSGKESMGAFSFAKGKHQTIVVGGDYAKDKLADTVAYILPDGLPAEGFRPTTGPAGFQSSVEYLQNDLYLATGTSGSNITTDGGKTWQKIDGNSYNVCRKAKHGKLVLLAGDRGRIGVFEN